MVLTSNGRALEQVQFTQLRVKEQMSEERLPDMGDGDSTGRPITESEAKISPQTLDSSWRVKWLPPGFEPKNSNIERAASENTGFHHLAFSDGLAMVTVFVENLMNSRAAFQGYSSRGAVNMFSRVEDDYQVTVVGDVPFPTIEKISTSIVKIDQ